MTDKELLELAAKAAEIKIRWSADSLGNQTGPWIFNSRWNPLTDDGDALRLAVKLGLDVCIDKPPVIGEPYTQAIGFVGDGR